MTDIHSSLIYAHGLLDHTIIKDNGVKDTDIAKQYRPMLQTVLRLIRLWPPHYCMLCQPYLVCTLLGPWTMHLRATFAAPNAERGALERDMIKATLDRISEYWDFATATSGRLVKQRPIELLLINLTDHCSVVLNQLESNEVLPAEFTGQTIMCLLPKP